MLFVVSLFLVTNACTVPIVLEHPTTKERVNCTTEADRFAYDRPSYRTGKDVPQREPISPGIKLFDYEQQCAGTLLREGFVCISGCKRKLQESD